MGAKRIKTSRGSGLINSIINRLPFEAHLPGYRYCGPGTKLAKRLKRGDPGINPLDEACKHHDIAYSEHNDTASRNNADKILAEKAWKRVQSSDSTLGEKLAARLVTSIMKGKVAMGAGSRKKKKHGGFLPLIPIIAALGAAAGGAAQIATAVNKKKAADKQLAEMARHNREMEAKGKGLHVRKKNNKKRKGGFLPILPLAASLAIASKIARNLKGNKNVKGNGLKTKKSKRKNSQNKNRISKNSGRGLYLSRRKP